MNGRTRRTFKSAAKVREVDLKIGKKGLTENFMKEARSILEKDGMIKFSHSASKVETQEIISKLIELLSVVLVQKVGKTLTFIDAG
jgi:RNA-binding protein YhbY